MIIHTLKWIAIRGHEPPAFEAGPGLLNGQEHSANQLMMIGSGGVAGGPMQKPLPTLTSLRRLEPNDMQPMFHSQRHSASEDASELSKLSETEEKEFGAKSEALETSHAINMTSGAADDSRSSRRRRRRRRRKGEDEIDKSIGDKIGNNDQTARVQSREQAKMGKEKRQSGGLASEMGGGDDDSSSTDRLPPMGPLIVDEDESMPTSVGGSQRAPAAKVGASIEQGALGNNNNNRNKQQQRYQFSIDQQTRKRVSQVGSIVSQEQTSQDKQRKPKPAYNQNDDRSDEPTFIDHGVHSIAKDNSTNVEEIPSSDLDENGATASGPDLGQDQAGMPQQIPNGKATTGAQVAFYRAPFFTSWFVSVWNILFMPVFTLISSCCFRNEDSSTKKLLV